ncbi:MAG: hypothetical protein ABEH43_01060, partial [Flavobacteriales bacterium]
SWYMINEVDEVEKIIPASSVDKNVKEAVNINKIENGIARLHPENGIKSKKLLKNYDAYYYEIYGEKHLPVWRIKMNDSQKTWYYVHPKTGEVMKRYTTSGRWDRWLYHGLHSLDFPGFYKEPFWYILIFILVIGGITLSGTGVVLAVKWILFKFSDWKK